MIKRSYKMKNIHISINIKKQETQWSALKHKINIMVNTKLMNKYQSIILLLSWIRQPLKEGQMMAYNKEENGYKVIIKLLELKVSKN